MDRVREINDSTELASLRPAWHAMVAATPGATFFQTPEWFDVYWRHFGGQQRLRVLVVESLGKPLGIVPLVVRTEPSPVGRVRVLTYPLDYWGTSYGPVGCEPEQTLFRAFEHIRETRRDWDVIDLRWIDAATGGCVHTSTALFVLGMNAVTSPMACAPWVDCTGTWADYLASRDPRFRQNVRRIRRKLEREGELRFVRIRPESGGDSDPHWAMYDECEGVARRSWQSRANHGNTLAHPNVRDFLREAHQTAVRMGAADMAVLYLNDRPAAFHYGYAWSGYLSGLRVGFDPLVTRAGAGVALLAELLADSFARGDRLFDLGPDYMACKRYWKTADRPIARLQHYAASPRAQALRAARWLRGSRVAKPATLADAQSDVDAQNWPISPA